MSRKLFVSLTFLLLIFIIGCSNNNISNHTKLEHVGNTPNPTGSIVIDGKEYQMIAGGFRWKAPDKEVLTDAASPDQIAKDFEPIPVESNSEIQIAIDKTNNTKLTLWEAHAITEIDSFKDNHFLAPEEPGEYIYEVTAIWANDTSIDGWTRGEVSYTFVIEVK